MEYEIKNKNSKFYLPSVEFWIMDDLGLTLRQGMLYKLIMFKDYLTWDNPYIAYTLRCSESTIKRELDELENKEVIIRKTKIYGSKARRVMVALYTVQGHRRWTDVNDLITQGFIKIEAEMGKYRHYKRRKNDV